MEPATQPSIVVLLGKYSKDGSESMRRYVDLIQRELNDRGCESRVWAPPTFVGHCSPSNGGFGKWFGYFDKFIIFPPILWWRLRRLKSKHPSAVIHICDHSDAMYSLLMQRMPHVTTCHDLTAVRAARGEITGQHIRWSGRMYQRLISAGIKHSRYIAAVSDATYQDLIRVFARDRICVIKNAPNYQYVQLDPSAGRAGMASLFNRLHTSPPDRFILGVGSNAWHKNRSGMIEIYARALSVDKDIPRLVLAGEILSDSLRTKAQELLPAGQIIEVAKVSNEELNALYCNADLLFFPSVAEGFGWPVIEAQAAGCRVVASALPPLLEIGGKSPTLIDVGNHASAANALVRSINAPPAEREAEIAAGLTNAAQFSRGKMIEQFLALYSELLDPEPEDVANRAVIPGLSH